MRRAINDQEEVKLSITPLIDVTFLLLIFFMCAMKFKTLERKVAAFLPKDKGISHERIKIPDEPKISVALTRGEGERSTRVELLGAQIGLDAAGFAVLDQHLMTIRNDPVNEKVPGEIDAGAEVPHADVVRCVDAFMKAGIRNIEFIGAPKPGKE